MTTRRRSGNTRAGRTWLNFELATKPLPRLEYVIVHELAHLIGRRHNCRFTAVLDRHVPRGRVRRDELNAAPLACATRIT